MYWWIIARAGALTSRSKPLVSILWTDLIVRARVTNRIAARFGRTPQGFTLVELLVVISIVSILLSLSMAGAVMARRHARRVQCINNLRQIGFALATYKIQWNRYPEGGPTNRISKRGPPGSPELGSAVGLGRLVKDELRDASVLYCPSASKITLGSAYVKVEQIGKVDAWCSYEYFRGGQVWDYNGPDNLNHGARFRLFLHQGSVRIDWEVTVSK